MASDSPSWLHGQALLQEIATTEPPAGALALWHIGQSGFFVKGGGLTLLFDPFLKPSDRRTFAPPVSPEEITAVDYVLCTHAHGDHLDSYAVEGIARSAPNALFVVPPAARQQVLDLEIAAERVISAAVGESQDLGVRNVGGGTFGDRMLTLHAVPASHGDQKEPVAEYVWDPHPERGYRFVGYVVELNEIRFYHAGDTTIYPGMVDRLRALNVDLALLPINGRDWFREQRGIIGNMDHREAADLGHAIGADVIVPMHYDMFAGNPGFPGWFVEYCVAQYPGQGFHVPVRSKRWIYVK